MKNICTYKEDIANLIVPNLWLGDNISSINKEFLNKHNINHVIRLVDELDFDMNDPIQLKDKNFTKVSFGYIYRINNITYYHFPITDKQMCNKDTKELFETTNFILSNLIKRDKSVLVHCKRGHHRSATVVGAYLLKHMNIDYKNVIPYINSFRLCSLRRETCLGKGLFEYSLYLDGKKCEKISCKKEKSYHICRCK